MPSNLPIAEFVFGAVLVFLAITGGKFELFGAKVAEITSNRVLRVVSFCLGSFLVIIALGVDLPSYLGHPVMNNSENIDYFNKTRVGSGGSEELRSIPNTTEAMCNSECLSDRSCKGYTYSKSQRKCFLKSEVGGEYPNSDTNSAKKAYVFP